jgi:Flp pilus assembly protein CpaB
MAMRRSTQMLGLGIAVFVIGAAVVFLSLGGGGDENAKATATSTSTTIQAGTVIIPTVAAPAPVSFTIPEGMQAVAVQVPFVKGLAGYAKAGDQVNVYGTLEKGPARTDGLPSVEAKLWLANVEVLAVNGPAAGTGVGDTTYLLALNAADAEKAIFLARFETMWLTLVPKGQPAATTQGMRYQ